MQAISEFGKPAFGGLHLLACFAANDRLEIAHHCRIRMRTGDRADAVKRITDIGDPIAKRLVHGILERACAGLNRAHFGAKNFHPQHIRLLPFDVDRTHINDTRQAELGAKRGGGNAMHAGAGFGNDAASCPCAGPA